MRWLYLFTFSFLLSMLLTSVFRKVSFRFKILDYPDERKIHSVPVPLLGGIGLYISFVITILLNFHFSLQLKGVVIGASIIVFMGLMDDIKPISAGLRLVGQILSALILIYCGVMVSFLPNVWWGKIGEAIITVIWIVGITNALNFLDGLDGLAAGLSAIAAGSFFVIAIQTNQVYLGYLSVVLAGAAIGFLFYNFYPAKIFLGDAGSGFLGFCLAGLAVMGHWAEKDPIAALSVPVLILGVLIFDMIYITLSRIKKRKVSSFRSWIEYVGKDHFHHRLLKLGFSHRQAAVFIYLVALCLGLSAITLRHASASNAIFLLLQAVLVFLIVAILMNVNKAKIEE